MTTPPSVSARPRSTVVVWTLVTLRFVLAALFGYAAALKLQNPQAFAFSVKAFDILPDHLAMLATFAVPWTEVVIAACLILGFWTRAAAALLALVLLVFIVAIASVLNRGLSVKCGCFGDAAKGICGDTLGWCNVVQNSALLCATLAVVWGGHGRAGIDGVLRQARRGP